VALRLPQVPTGPGWRLPRWPGWSRLPREGRDTLFLLGVIAWTVLPHVPHLPAWCTSLTAVVLLWRAALAVGNGALPGRWLLVAVLAVAAGLTFMSFRTLLGKEPGVTMAVVLMALKTLELRARRDAFVVFFLGFFLVLTHFLYSQSLAVAAAMLVSVWGLLTALVLAHMPAGQPSLKQAARLAGRTALLGAPIMLLLFMLFPRIGPLWGVPKDGLSSTGLSDRLRLGQVAEVALDDRIAMRLRFEGDVPRPDSLYFRGPVLASFDGTEWRALLPRFPAGLQPHAELRATGVPLRYEMTIEPLRLPTLPLLEASASVPQIAGYRVRGTEDLQWLTDRPLIERLRFRAEANLRFEHGPREAVPGLQDYRELPRGFNPRTLAWAAALRADPALANAGARELAQRVLRHIREGGYSYTLAPGEYGRDAIDEFWLDRKEGFCEHFAAAFVVVMRALDVPARIVTGYQGADPLPVDGYYIVRQSAAHAWAEYWQPGAGWVRADPTAAVAPDRIQRSLRLAPPPGLVAGAIHAVNPQLMLELREAWEAVNNRWNQWVLNYSRGQQFDLLKDLGIEAPDWQTLATLLVTALSALALIGAAWAWWDRHRVDPWIRQREALLGVLRRAGIAADLHDAPGTLARRVRQRHGAAGEPLAALIDTLQSQRYGRDARRSPDPALTRSFAAAARGLAAAASR
jgi:transglutaminase-like putative cysteine protease